MSVPRPLTEKQIAELQRQLAILESKSAQATEPVVRDALLSKIGQIKTQLGVVPEAKANIRDNENDKAYHVFLNGAAQGPINAETVRAMIVAGQLQPDSKIWTQGMKEWSTLSEFSDFAEDLLPIPSPEMPAVEHEAMEPPSPQADSASQKKKRWEDEVVLPAPASQDQIVKADEFVRQARIAKMRGNAQEYSRLLRQAEQVAPGAASVLEALGDDLLAQNNVGEARLAYYKAHRMAPKNVQIERKYAEVVFKASASKGWQTQMMMEAEVVENAKRAAAVSAFVPGAGQIVLGDQVKGGIMVAIWLLGVFGITIYVRSVAGAHTRPSILVVFLLMVFIANYVYAIVDCLNRAKGKGETAGLMAYVNAGEGTTVKRDKKERPIPPENLPFE